MKEFKGRWYLIANDHADELIKTFGLDRIQVWRSPNENLIRSQGFDAYELFKDYFGILNGADQDREEVILSFDYFQGKYIKSFPLHASQEVIRDNVEETRIRLSLYITYDFVMELLSFGDRVKVISPETLKDQVCEIYENALGKYEA